MISKRLFHVTMSLFIAVCLAATLAGCGDDRSPDGNSNGGSGAVLSSVGYTLTGKVALPDGSSGAGILVLASKLDEGGVSGKQARVLAARPAVKTSFNRAVSTAAAETAGSYATVTDANGIYVLTGLDTGTYYIEATRGGLKAKGRGTVSPTAATVVDLALTPTGSITGCCLLEDGLEEGHAGTFVVIEGTDYIGYTNSNGHFTISQVPVGEYRVCFVHQGYGTCDYDGMASVPAAAACLLDTVTLETLAGGVIEGTVTAQDGESVEGAMVKVAGTELYARTGDSGAYRLEDVHPGTRTVLFRHDLIEGETESDPVMVEHGGLVTADATLTDEKAPVWESTPGVVYVTEIVMTGSGYAEPSSGEVSVAVEFGRAFDASPPLAVMVYFNRLEDWDPQQWDNNNPGEYGESEVYDGIRGERGVVIEGLYPGERYVFGVRLKDRHGNLEYNRSEYLCAPGESETTPQERENLLAAIGNIGIGTKDPQGLFHVEAEDGTSFVINEQTGYVGIGTTSPDEALTVGPETFRVNMTGEVTAGEWKGSPIANEFIEGVSGSKVDGDIAGKAANVTGIVDIEHGGTSADTAEGARESLGLHDLAELSAVSGGYEGTIEDGTITADDLAEGAVTGAAIENATITADDLVEGAVTGSIIEDATITGDDINATAAIAGTKISPSFGHQDIITMGKVGISTTEPKADLHVVGSVIMGPALGVTAEAGMVQFDGTAFKGYDGLNWKALDSQGTTGTAWGDITGAFEDQTDLQGELDSLQGDIDGLQTSVDAKEAAITTGTTTEYFRGDKTWQPMTTTAVTEGDNLYWTQDRFDTAVTGKTTDDLSEGSTNKYYTQQGFDTAFTAKTTDDLTEGSTNKYWSQSQFDTSFSAKAVPDLSDVALTTMEDGQLLKYNTSTSRWENWTPDFQVGTAWGGITGTLSSQTDLQAELDGLQGDIDSLQTAVDSKEPALTAGATTEYYRGDKTWQTLTTTAVAEGDNLFYTSTRFDTALGGKTTDDLSEGSTNKYFTTGGFDTAFSAKTTDDLAEGTANLYSPWNIGDGVLTCEGSVGIGTGIPANKLTVVTTSNNDGLSLVNNTGYNTYIRFYEGASVKSSIAHGGASDMLKLMCMDTGSITLNDGITEVLRVQDENVGIGTDAPADKLHVNGGLILGTTTGTNAGTIRFNGGTFEGYTGSEWKALDVQPTGSAGGWTEGTGIVTLTTTGDSVGIGTADPSTYKLNVAGTSYFGDSIALADTKTIDGRDLSVDGTKLDGIEASADATDATNVAAAGAVMDGDFTAEGLMKRGSTEGTYSMVTDNSANWTIAYTDRMKWDGDAEGLVAATGRESLGLVTGTDVQAYDAGLQSISGLTTAPDQMLYTTAADTFAVTALTNAGRTLLDDADAAAQRTTLGLGTAATSAIEDFMSADTDNWVDITGDTMTGTLNLSANGLVAGTDQLVISGGNVGIGTVIPAEKLHVYAGNIKLSGGGGQIWMDIDSSTHAYLYLDRGAQDNNSLLTYRTEGTSKWGIGLADDATAEGLMFTNTLATPLAGAKMYIKSTGEVGIGTTSPSQKLDVVGTANMTALAIGGTAVTATAAEINFVDGVTSTIQTQLDTKATSVSPTFTGNITLPGTGIWNSSGNVGIGTTGPGAKLDVAGHIWQTQTGQSVFIGEEAGANDDLSDNKNTFVGYYAGNSNTTGYENSAMGWAALRLNTTGYGNSAMGSFALSYNTIGKENSAMGYYALKSNTTGSSNSAIGYCALKSNTTGSNNSAMGYGALYVNSEGSNNSAMGYDSLRLNTTGYQNSAMGRDALYSNTTGYQNSAMGVYALRANTIGSSNSAMGYGALYVNTTGTSNSAMGKEALRSNSEGYNNSAIGNNALDSNTTGYKNSAIGNNALDSNITGNNNVALGHWAGRYQADGSTGLADPENSIYIGTNAKGFDNNDNNSIVIGYDAVGIGANTVVLGNDAVVTTALKGNVGIGTTAPSSKMHIYNGASGQSTPYAHADDLVIEHNLEAGLSILTPSTKVGRILFGDESNAAIGGFVYNHTNDAMELYANGTERVRITSNGNVGIGTTDPGVKLQVAGDIVTTDTQAMPSNIGFVRILYNKTAEQGLFQAYDSSTSQYKDLKFEGETWRIDTGTSSLTTGLYQDSSGNIGIGTTAPTTKLEVVYGGSGSNRGITSYHTYTGAAGPVIRIRKARGTSASPTAVVSGDTLGHVNFEAYDGTGFGAGGQIQVSATQDWTSTARGSTLFFKTAANDSAAPTTRMLITHDGNVGIGTTDPATTVHLYGSGQPHLKVESTDSNAGFNVTSGHAQGEWTLTSKVEDGGFQLYNIVTTNIPLYVLPSGNVGIGTSSPVAKLHVHLPYQVFSGDTALKLGMQNFGASVGNFINLDFGSESSTHARISADFRVNPRVGLAFSTMDSSTLTEKMFIDGNGNVGIGTTSPANILTVKQTSATDPIADAWTTYSSRRWKEDIRPIGGALDKVMNLRGVRYAWKANGQPDIGLIAEEVGVVVPEVVLWEENGQDARSVDYGRINAVLIEAIKELKEQKDAEIETLKTRLEVLEAQLHK